MIRFEVELDLDAKYTPTIYATVRTSERRWSYGHSVPTPFLESYFEFVWRHIGEELKRAMKEDANAASKRLRD